MKYVSSAPLENFQHLTLSFDSFCVKCQDELERMSSYVGSVAASRVHHDRKVQFGLRNRSAKPSQMDQ